MTILDKYVEVTKLLDSLHRELISDGTLEGPKIVSDASALVSKSAYKELCDQDRKHYSDFLKQQSHINECLRLQEAITEFHNSENGSAPIAEELLRQFRTMLSDDTLDVLIEAT